MLPSLEAFSAQETNDAGIPSLQGNVGGFQCEGDVTLPFVECHLLIFSMPVKLRWLEDELTSGVAIARIRLNVMVLKEVPNEVLKDVKLGQWS